MIDIDFKINTDVKFQHLNVGDTFMFKSDEESDSKVLFLKIDPFVDDDYRVLNSVNLNNACLCGIFSSAEVIPVKCKMEVVRK